MLVEWVAGVTVQSEMLDGPAVKGETHLTTRLLSSFGSVQGRRTDQPQTLPQRRRGSSLSQDLSVCTVRDCWQARAC